MDYECSFAAFYICKFNPKKIVDVGSYRQFLLGLLAHYQVTTIDVRSRKPILDNEFVITCDAKNLNLPDNSMDAVTSLCALAHFGLGRYGDKFDLDADKKAFKEMIRRFCADLKCIDEKFYSQKIKGFCSLEEVVAEPEIWDLYCGCWEKKQG